MCFRLALGCVPQNSFESGRGELQPGTVVDLGERDGAGGYCRDIARTLASHEVFEDAAAYVGGFVGAA